MHTTTSHSVAIWARDFSLLGLAVGALAPLMVIFDPWFSIAAGVAGASTGLVVGGGLGLTVDQLRSRLPLAVWCSIAAVVGALWGAAVGTVGGTAAAVSGSVFGEAAILFGFIVGATSGMVGLGIFFPAYLFAKVRGWSTLPVVGGGMALSPLVGWAGLVGLALSTFGIWLFAVPGVVWLAVLADRSQQRLLLDREAVSTGWNDRSRRVAGLSIG